MLCLDWNGWHSVKKKLLPNNPTDGSIYNSIVANGWEKCRLFEGDLSLFIFYGYSRKFYRFLPIPIRDSFYQNVFISAHIYFQTIRIHVDWAKDKWLMYIRLNTIFIHSHVKWKYFYALLVLVCCWVLLPYFVVLFSFNRTKFSFRRLCFEFICSG